MHDGGTLLAFVAAIVYGWMIVHITKINMTPDVHYKVLFYLRIALAILETTLAIICILCND